jgi:hypothetical protein
MSFWIRQHSKASTFTDPSQMTVAESGAGSTFRFARLTGFLSILVFIGIH